MVSRSIRSCIIPKNVIVLHQNVTKPTDFTNETSLFDKYAVAQATTVSAPGGTSGAATHTHTALVHNHTTTTALHGHDIFTSTATPECASNTSDNAAATSHTHKWTNVTTTPTISVTNTCHTHNAITNDPQSIQAYYIKKTSTSINLRRKSLGKNVTFMWPKPSACLPSKYSIDTTYNCNFVKGVLNACISFFGGSGSNTHTHTAAGVHTHTLNLPNHTHTPSGLSTQLGNTGLRCLTALRFVSQSHNHCPGTIATTSSGTICKASESGGTCHTHDTLDKQPKFKTISYVTTSSIGMRYNGLPKGAIVGWIDSIATIPSGWQMADGTNSTSNYICATPWYLKGSGTPGTTGGGPTHTHASAGSASHTHASSTFSHTHPVTGTSSVSGGTQTATQFAGSGLARSCHTHVAGSASTTCFTASLVAFNEAHTHGATNHSPASVTLAFIEKL